MIFVNAQQHQAQHRQKRQSRPQIERCRWTYRIPQPAGNQTRRQERQANHAVIVPVGSAPLLLRHQISHKGASYSLYNAVIDSIAGKEQPDLPEIRRQGEAQIDQGIDEPAHSDYPSSAQTVRQDARRDGHKGVGNIKQDKHRGYI